MKVAINCKKFEQPHISFLHKLFQKLKENNIDYILNEDAELDDMSLHTTYSHQSDFNDIDFFLSIGGDGTLLSTLTYIGALQTPILGINTGRLGFLVTSTTDEIDLALTCIQEGKYEVEKRTVLHLDSDPTYFHGDNFALNEVAILKQDSSSMITIKVSINGQYLNSYWADGLVVSTPTGSTGYSLSCGGPIVQPGSENFIISPVCPHNLNVRPLIVNDNAELSIEVESRNPNFLLVLDSRSQVVTNPVKIVLRKEAFTANIIKLEGYNYYNTLRKKLYWGSDARN